MKKKLLLGIGLAALLTLTACGNTSKDTSKETQTKEHYPLTIENFSKAEGGSTWEKKDQVFDKAPERIMANTRPAAELLLHLGLSDKIVGVGANFGAVDKAVEEEYAKLNILSDEYVGKEVTLGTDPDLVFGRGGLFDNAEWGVGTVDSLNEMGVKTYVLESSVTGGTYDSIYKDIKNIGEIFNVQDKADSFIKELKGRQQDISSKLESIKEEKTFAYLHTNDPKELFVYPAHDETFFNDAFKMVKLDNIFKDETGDVSVETLIAADPDVLILPNWDGSDLTKVREEIYANPKLSSMKAIKNKQMYIVDYNYMFGYGYNTIDGMEALAKEMYPDLFK
ncbi:MULTISPECIES: ABC transporter substrate-binding protein [Lysinibacillus]|uniref:ABC transporter substrate-binding protein n=1 Tax=Lysinibacillus TaxID=400634 RepID=UPI002175CF63|nr:MULTISPECIES: ABC transporter substrate-binding protein [Lysinibacillus]MCS5503868.1 ABC transporter substrate-binding protein [Lysinibacillus sp. A4]MCT1541408.1 ABC transporter substrate-binding protein [Lysinibacillus capsici]MCT1572692.1 ABC transporter substrate-binding protein [Lysinibacillus capsici]MCT1649810.1 ABC transporter substrate-binding protein [Lysinibacillus capsici]MCT1728336.1 ABC transporter substrate-binding protein [Lysinibacillus capsici]